MLSLLERFFRQIGSSFDTASLPSGASFHFSPDFQ